jgi:hypothetical protein
VRSAKRRRKKADALGDVCVSHDADVQLPVDDGCIRGDPERSTEKSSVRHSEHEKFGLRGACLDGDRYAFVGKELCECGVDVESVALEKSDAGGGLEDGSVEPEAATVDEMSAFDAPDIDPGTSAGYYQVRDLIRCVFRDAQCFGEIVSRPRGNDCERAVGAGFDESIRDSPAGSVPTYDGDRLPPGVDGLESDALFVTPLACLLDVPDAKRGEGLRDFLQSSPRRAFSGRRVEDEPRDWRQ